MQAQTHPVQYLDFWKGTSRRTRKYPEVYIKKASFLEDLARSEQGIGAEVIEIEDTPEEANGIRQDGLGGFTQEHAITIIEEEPEVMEVQKSQRELLTLLEGSTSSAKKSHTPSYFQQELAYLNNPPASKSQTNANLAHKKVEQAPAIFYEEVSAIFCNCKISLSMKDIHEYSEAQALIIPFESSQLELYPGCWLRDELASQCEKLSKAEIIDGGIYIKRKTGIHNYNYLVFLKVQLEEFANNLKIGLNLLLKKIRNDSKDISSMVLCLQEGIDVGSILEGLTKSSQLRKCNHLNLNLSCKDQSRFQEQFKRFLKLTR